MVSSKANLHIGPDQIALHSQKLVFKVKFRGEADPWGFGGVEPPKNSKFFINQNDNTNSN